MAILTALRRLANAATVFFGPHGAVTEHARACGLSRQALYRDAEATLDDVQGARQQQQLAELRERVHEQAEQLAALEQRLARAIVVDDEALAAYASCAQAEGVSLPVARRLLRALGAARPGTSVASLGRLSRQAAARASALLPVLDEASRAHVRQAAADEIFFGPKPCLMVVEPYSFAWLSGRLSARRDSASWARELRPLTQLQQLSRDGGQGLRKGLALVNAERQAQGQAPVAEQDDHYHVLREGPRVLRQQQAACGRWLAKAAAAERRLQQQVRQSGSRQGLATAVAQAWRHGEQAFDAWARAERAWQRVVAGARLWTPSGQLNTRAQAEAVVQAALPELAGPLWAPVRQALRRPELWTFLDQAAQQLAALALPAEVRAAAVQVEAARRQPQALRGEGAGAGARRGVLLLASVVLHRAGPLGAAALAQVRGVLDRVWRASSLVEGINSVARMQQARHRRLNQSLLDLKRLYWNCRAFRTGRRRRQSPYERLGLKLPTTDWWQLLKLTPEQLRQHLSAQRVAA